MSFRRYLLGLAGCLLVTAIILSLASLILWGGQWEELARLQDFLDQIPGG